MKTREIVVGTDGTPPGSAAVEWAAREASRRHMRLRIVHAYDWEWRSAQLDASCGLADEDRYVAEAVVTAAERTARAVDATLEVRADAVVGDAVRCLLDAAENADLLVAGSRDRSGLTGWLSGSVGRHLVTHAPCAVVVVRGDGNLDDRPIVAGVDDGEEAEHVLATAFPLAAERGTELAVLHAFLPVAPLWGIDLPASAMAAPDEDGTEHDRIEQLIAPWCAKYPHVSVQVLISHAGAATVMASVSRGAQLVVIGSRGHGIVAGAVLGSTGAYLVHHAECPVWIVHPGAGDLS